MKTRREVHDEAHEGMRVNKSRSNKGIISVLLRHLHIIRVVPKRVLLKNDFTPILLLTLWYIYKYTKVIIFFTSAITH